MSREIYEEVDMFIGLTSVDSEYMDKVNSVENKNLEDIIDYNICDVCGKNEECGYVYCGILCCSKECFKLAVKYSIVLN